MKRYRIVRWERYDKKGELKSSYFYIEKSHKIFRWTFWKYVTLNNTSKKRMEFNFITEAQHFIEEILIPGKPYDTETTKVMEIY